MRKEKLWMILYWEIGGARLDGPYDDKDAAVTEAHETCEGTDSDLFAHVFKLKAIPVHLPG